MTRYLLAGARGGQGTTTTAVLLAHHHAATGSVLLVSPNPNEILALISHPAGHVQACHELAPGLSLTSPDQLDHAPAADIEVWDLGRLDQAPDHDPGGPAVRTVIHRGPDYLSAWHHTRSTWPADTIILLTETGRALRPTDLTEITSLPITTTIPITPAIARTLDAGLLLTRPSPLHVALAATA